MDNVTAYYGLNAFDGSVITVTDKDYYDRTGCLDDCNSPNSNVIEDAVIACGYDILAENIYERDSDETVFVKSRFEKIAAKHGVTMIFNQSICDIS